MSDVTQLLKQAQDGELDFEKMEFFMLQRYLPVFIVFLFGVLGCASTETVESTKVSSTEIYQSYIIEGTKNQTTVTATFRVGGSTGSTVDLDAPSKILHNGKEMNESAPGFMKGTDYHASADNLVTNHKFAYTDANGKTWQNEISLEPIEIISKDLSISKSGSGVFTLSRPVEADESIDFGIYSEKTPPPSTGNSNSANNAPEILYQTNLQTEFDASRTIVRIKTGSLKNFVGGKAEISFVVRKNKSTQQSAKGGSMAFSYQSQKVSVNVIN